MQKKFVLFDFDGVIVDSYRVAFGVQSMTCPGLTEEAYQRRFDANIHEGHDPMNSHSAKCRHDIDFFTEYLPRMKKEATIFPGMNKVINELGEKYTSIVISSTVTSPIQEFLDEHNLSHHFDWVMGADVHKSKVEKIKMVFDKYGIGASDCVFITDTLGDMREAEKMGVASIGVLWGFQDEFSLRQGKPFKLVTTPEEVSLAVSDYFASLST